MDLCVRTLHLLLNIVGPCTRDVSSFEDASSEFRAVLGSGRPLDRLSIAVSATLGRFLRGLRDPSDGRRLPLNEGTSP